MDRRKFVKSMFIFTGALWVPKSGILRVAEARLSPAMLGSTPTAVSSGSVGNLVHTDTMAYENTSLGFIVKTATAGTVSYGHVWCTAINTKRLAVQLCNNSGVVLAYGQVVMSGTATGWVNIPLNTSVLLTATTYWCCTANSSTTALTYGSQADVTNTYAWNNGWSWTYTVAGDIPTATIDLLGGNLEDTENVTVYFDNNSGDPA